MAKQVIVLLEQYLCQLGYQAAIHFEIEGCYASNKDVLLDFDLANEELQRAKIIGRLVPEFWQRQWEFVSDFNGQSPLEEAISADRAIKIMPNILKKQGISQTIISPVVWGGDSRRMLRGSKQLFTHESRQVHIPNAIQLNVSVNNLQGENIIAQNGFGQRLQQCFINTSQQCALLYLPEALAFERLLLKEKYGLSDELCSPTDISGGHQGSVALYLDKGKHNQKMGETPLLYDQHQKVILSAVDWRKTARVEHRLGASSQYYNPYINVVYALLNVVDAINDQRITLTNKPVNQNYLLPRELHGDEKTKGAVEIFARETWFAECIDSIEQQMVKAKSKNTKLTYQGLGEQLKQAYLTQYQQVTLIY